MILEPTDFLTQIIRISRITLFFDHGFIKILRITLIFDHGFMKITRITQIF